MGRSPFPWTIFEDDLKFSEPQRDSLVRLGLFPEQIELLEEFLPECAFAVRKQPARTDLDSKLQAVEKPLMQAQEAFAALRRQRSAAAGEALLRLAPFPVTENPTYMPLGDVRSVHCPICIKKQSDGTYVVLNREYKPLGFRTKDSVNYAGYPICVKLRGLRAATGAKISYRGSPDLDVIYLYNDGCIPTDSAAHMTAYLKRLAVFAKLKVS